MEGYPAEDYHCFWKNKYSCGVVIILWNNQKNTSWEGLFGCLGILTGASSPGQNSPMAWPTASESGGTWFDSRRVRLDFVPFSKCFFWILVGMLRTCLGWVCDLFRTLLGHIFRIVRKFSERLRSQFPSISDVRLSLPAHSHTKIRQTIKHLIVGIFSY